MSNIIREIKGGDATLAQNKIHNRDYMGYGRSLRK